MDWDSNLSSTWDGVSKLGVQDNNNNYHQHLATYASSSGSATVMNNINNNSMFSVDLKLGRFEDMRDLSVDTLKNPGALVMASSGSSRTRGRARNAGAQTTVYCSVDGCTSDLSQCREYHRRHRVCERHSKTPVVLIAGKEQRFCQQCSRFHSLGEFDEVKRSCRKRLDGHNRRRRKTQPENFYMNSGSLHSSHTGSNPRSNTGNGLIQFRSLQMHTSPWSMISQPDQKTTPIYNHYDPLTSFTDSISWSTICTRGDKHSSFPANITNQHETGHEQLPLLRDCTTPSATNSSKLDGLKVISPPDSRLLTQSSHAECALSLLSRHPARSSGMYSPSHMTQPLAARSSAQGFGSALHLNDGFAQFSSTDHHTMEDENNSVSISSTTSNDNAHSFGGFLTGHDGFCANNSSRVFPFTWG